MEPSPIESVSFNIKLLQIAGLWPSQNNYYKGYQLFITLWLAIFNLVEGSLVILNITHLFDVLGILMLLPNTVGASAKNLILRRKFEQMQQLFIFLNKKKFQPKREQQQQIKIVKNGIKLSKRLFLSFFLSVILCLIGLTILPLFNKDDKLPWPVPFNYDTSICFVLVYILQAGGIIYLGLNNIAVDTLFAVNLTQIGVQCDLLYNKVVNLVDKNEQQQQDDDELINDYQHLKLKLIDCIEHYRLILEYCEQLLVVFNHIILIQFTCSMSVICLTTFALTYMSPTSLDFFKALFYENVIFIQILLYCWPGNEISDKSNKLSWAVYETNWIDCPQRFKKDLLFFMIMVKKPIVMIILDLIPVNLITFMGIVRSAFAYFNALYNLRK